MKILPLAMPEGKHLRLPEEAYPEILLCQALALDSVKTLGITRNVSP